MRGCLLRVWAILSGDESAVARALKEQVKHLDSEGQDLGVHYPSGAFVAG
jgi:hypothetical protein